MATRRLSGMTTSSSVPDNGGDHSGGGGSAGGYVDDVFSTYVYEGTGADRDIVNGVDLAGEGGLVWIKSRSNGSGLGSDHYLMDTEQPPAFGSQAFLSSNLNAAADGSNSILSSFNSDGFSVSGTGANRTNVNGSSYVSWTFRKAPKFFDIVTYTGDGAFGRTIPHNLETEAGMVIVKELGNANNWLVWHRGMDSVNNHNAFLNLNSAASSLGMINRVSGGADFSKEFWLASNSEVNRSGGEFVAYVFAHDDSDESIIKCGSYTGNGNLDGPEIDLGFEPQWLLIKSASTARDWMILDTMRGIVTDDKDPWLKANTSDAEDAFKAVSITPTGFKITATSSLYNENNATFIYMAIRRPSKPAEEFEPEELFAVDTSSNLLEPTFTSGFPVDFSIYRQPVDTTSDLRVGGRLNQGQRLYTNTTQSEGGEAAQRYDYMEGYNNAFHNNYPSWMWRRAPGFFDVVAHTADGSADSLYPHSLGVVPDMVWRKERSIAGPWNVWVRAMPNGNDGANGNIKLNENNTYFPNDTQWAPSIPPTDTHLSNGKFKTAGVDVISYLFASVPGISKVGIYTGTGTDLDIDCEFTTGARFVLIKRTDDTGDWMFFDTERGITSSGSPMLKLNENEAQASGSYIKPHSKGFTATSNLASIDGAEYIFYAIA